MGQASFLTAAADARRRRLAPRAYTKSSVLTYDRDADIETDEDEEDDPWSTRSGGETDEFEDSGFSAEEDEDFESDDADSDDEPLDDDEED